MTPTPKMTVALRVDTYQELAALRELWNEHFHDGKECISMDSTIKLLMLSYRRGDSAGTGPTFKEFAEWVSKLPKRGRPRMVHPKPRSRPPNPLDMDVMMDRDG